MRRNPPRPAASNPATGRREHKINLLGAPVSTLRLVVVVAVPYWVYVTAAELLIAHGWSMGLVEAEDVAPASVRAVQHTLSMLISIPVYVLAMRTGFPGGRRWLAGVIHLLLGVSFAALVRPTLIGVWIAMTPEMAIVFEQRFDTRFEAQLGTWLMTTVTYVMIYAFGLALMAGVATYLKLRDEKLHIANLENESMRARLQALRMQLNPHFLFNALHTITALVGKRPEVAEEMLVRLSELLRRVLRDGDEDWVSLQHEVGFVKNYLDIESLRFRDRMRIRFDVEASAGDARVPSLILQPLVENAVRHGVAARDDDVRIAVTARRDGGWLEITVRNSTAAAPPHNIPEGEGIGLGNTRTRLETMFGERYRMETGYVAPEEFVARLRFPFVPIAPTPESTQPCLYAH